MMFGCPRVLAVLPGLYPSTIIGVVKPLLKLHQAARIVLDVSFESLVRRRNLEQADVVVFCRNFEPKYGHVLSWALELAKPIIYELDDNLLEAPDTTPILRHFRTPERQAQLKKYLREADLIRVYAPALQRYLTAYNPHVFRVNGPLDWSLLPDRPPLRDPKRVRLVYVTSRLEDEIGLMLIKPVQRVLEAFPETELFVWGPQLKALHGHPRVHHLQVIMDYDSFFQTFAQQGFDIGLAPLPDDLFYQCKSNNKFREYAACRVAGIYSDTEVYRECVINGATGLLVGPQEEAWFEAMARLVEDVPLRERIQDQAHAYAQQHYSQENMQSDWLIHIEQVLADKPAATKTCQPGELKEFAYSEVRPRDEAIVLAVGILRQAIRYSSRLIPTLKSRGAHVTLGQILLNFNAFKQLIALKIALWRLQRR